MPKNTIRFDDMRSIGMAALHNGTDCKVVYFVILKSSWSHLHSLIRLARWLQVELHNLKTNDDRLTQIQTGSCVMKLTTSFNWVVKELVAFEPTSSNELSGWSPLTGSSFSLVADASEDVNDDNRSLFVSTAMASLDDFRSDEERAVEGCDALWWSFHCGSVRTTSKA